MYLTQKLKLVQIEKRKKITNRGENFQKKKKVWKSKKNEREAQIDYKSITKSMYENQMIEIKKKSESIYETQIIEI